jgi:alanine-glyoxylate transaminase/serine-glyoxylate transaminase/serine-pyruvate transaminase
VLVCVGGYFGARIAEMARRHGGDVQTIECAWGNVFSQNEIKEALKKRPAKIVAIVQAETSTGAMQPLEGLADIVHSQGGIFLVDAVTSLGGISVGVDKNGIDVCYSATQKCLGCPPGLGPVTVGPRALEAMKSRKKPASAWYLDLSMVNQYWGPERAYHHTAPISSNYALYEGLRLIMEEGLEQRWARHLQNAELLWEGLESMNLELHVPKAIRLPTLTTVKVPNGIDEVVVRRRLLDEYNIEIAGGFGELKGKVWRIGLMGFSSRRENILVLLSALQKLIHK